MISMTGFGRAEVTRNGNTVTVEVSAVNSRKQRDVRVNLPRELTAFEPLIKKAVLERVQRGTVGITVNYSLSPELRAESIVIDVDVAAHVAEKLRALAKAAGAEMKLSVADLLEIPGVLVETGSTPLEALEEPLEEALGSALDGLHETRMAEGEHLKRDLYARLATMRDILGTIDERRDQAFVRQRDRLVERIETLGLELDTSDERLAKEVAFCAEKCDVTEEVVRLESHLSQFRDLVETEDKDVGRELDFLCQEMNREATTIGSKAADTEVAERSIALKAELARVREQVMNIE